MRGVILVAALLAASAPRASAADDSVRIATRVAYLPHPVHSEPGVRGGIVAGREWAFGSLRIMPGVAVDFMDSLSEDPRVLVYTAEATVRGGVVVGRLMPSASIGVGWGRVEWRFGDTDSTTTRTGMAREVAVGLDVIVGDLASAGLFVAWTSIDAAHGLNGELDYRSLGAAFTVGF